MISPGASMISPFDASISMKAETEFESGAAAAAGAAARNAPEGGAAATPVASHDAAGACDWIVFEGGVVSESDESEDGELVAGEGGAAAAGATGA